MMRTQITRLAFGVVFLASNALAQLPTPELKSIYPPGCKARNIGRRDDWRCESRRAGEARVFTSGHYRNRKKRRPNALGKEKVVAESIFASPSPRTYPRASTKLASSPGSAFRTPAASKSAKLTK